MKFGIRSILLAWFLGFFLTSFSHADALKLAAVGTANFSGPRINTGTGPVTSSSTLGLGIGGLASFPLVPDFRLETGLLYIKSVYSFSGTEFTLNHLQIPAVVRFDLLPFLSLGGGFYYSFGLGNVGTRVGNVTTDVTYDAFNLSSSDLGAIVSAALDLTIGPASSLLVDVRYLYGLKNLTNLAGQTFRLSSFLFLVGVKFGL